MPVTTRQSSKSSVFRTLTGVEYFAFEEDFVEQNIRCIPMIVRFKMDAAGIKLKLAEWSKFTNNERVKLAIMPCITREESAIYYDYLAGIVQQHVGQPATTLIIDHNPPWRPGDIIPEQVLEMAREHACEMNVEDWNSLTNLQRFALLKLCRPGHESKNFIKALREFKLLNG
jgi:hypothetical protein